MINFPACCAILLGLAQDAGVPQINCQCQNCLEIKSRCGWPVSLAIVDDNVRKYWIIDATPRFTAQFNWLRKQYPGHEFSGIFLTHAHIGHYSGLMYLGREAMASNALPVFASLSMQNFLSRNEPWSRLISARNVVLHDLQQGNRVILTKSVAVMPVAVDHRSEFSDTHAMQIFGEVSSLFYCPDIDRWNSLNLHEYIQTGDHALLDGTFFSEDELPGRDLTEIPHPLVTQTVEFVKNRPFKTWLIHLNHTNPLWRSGRQRALLGTYNISIPKFGQLWRL